MRDLRLKYIQMDVDFRKSEETNFLELSKSGNLPKLKKGEGVLFVSCGGNQCVFVEAYEEFMAHTGKTVKVLASQRFRIRGGKWNPLMIKNYAEHVGLNIVGIKRFEWHYKEYLAEQEAA